MCVVFMYFPAQIFLAREISFIFIKNIYLRNLRNNLPNILSEFLFFLFNSKLYYSLLNYIE